MNDIKNEVIDFIKHVLDPIYMRAYVAAYMQLVDYQQQKQALVDECVAIYLENYGHQHWIEYEIALKK